ncbi:MAG: ribosome biogenesis GTPase Der [Gammaproteobacteria bacterium]|nr:ribosome biogenesis GTPase Der [Gammaproteobacteria bacterium]
MIPVIALVGRPNVGKSTLFNVFTRSRDAIVADEPGLTRDRQYGVGERGERVFIVVDTGGLSGTRQVLDDLMARQTRLAIDEADEVLFIVDARDGLTAGDRQIADLLRKSGKSCRVVINKIDGVDPDQAAADFYALGFAQLDCVAASQRKGTGALLDSLLQDYPPAQAAADESAGPSVAIIGRPNVGKSTLINRLVGEERVVAFDAPGTTRDTIEVPFERRGKAYTLIDTAGVRRRGKVREAVEKFSVIKALDAIEKADVVVLVIDAREGLTDQDLTLLGYVLDAGRALVIAINKWDGLDDYQREQNRENLQRRLEFVPFAARHFISAKHGTGVGDLMKSVDQAYASARADFNTRYLTDLLEEAVFRHNPPLHHGRRIKLRYAHQGGRRPPVIVIHGNQTNRLPQSYLRYLTGFFIDRLGLKGTPLRIETRAGENPYAPKKGSKRRKQGRPS